MGLKELRSLAAAATSMPKKKLHKAIAHQIKQTYHHIDQYYATKNPRLKQHHLEQGAYHYHTARELDGDNSAGFPFSPGRDDQMFGTKRRV